MTQDLTTPMETVQTSDQASFDASRQDATSDIQKPMAHDSEMLPVAAEDTAPIASIEDEQIICEWESCSRIFTTLRDLVIHVNAHVEELPWGAKYRWLM